MAEHNIYLKIGKEDELFHAFDPTGQTLSDEVVSYVQDKFRDRRIGEKINLQIISEEKLDESRVKEAIKKLIERENSYIKREHRRNRFEMMRMFIIGGAFIFVSILLEVKVNVIWYTILSTIGAFAMWEAASYLLVKDPKLNISKLALRKLSQEVDITFVYRQP